MIIDGADITGLRGAGPRRVRERYGVVFQGGALFDSMTVLENVAFPLREKPPAARRPSSGRGPRQRSRRSGCRGWAHKYPAEISGGMRKRVAIARALVTEPEIVFFDEPTTGLDPILVNTIHHLILELHRKFRFTAVMVSHEIPEIFEIADRVAMLHEGRILVVGTPEAIQGSATRSCVSSSAASSRNRPSSGRRSRKGTEAVMGRRVELGVGLFMVAGILALGYLSMKLGRVDSWAARAMSSTRTSRRWAASRPGRPWRSPASRSGGWSRSASRTTRRGSPSGSTRP